MDALVLLWMRAYMMRLALLLLLLALFDPPRGWAGNKFHERNHTGLLALYGFDDGQRSADLHPTTARDYTGLGLLGNLTTSTSTISWSSTRAGFSVPSATGGTRAVSQQNTTSIMRKLPNEFSIEMFLVSPTNPGGNVLVAGFGDWPPGAALQPSCDSSDVTTTVEGGWRLISSLGNGLRFQVVMAENGVSNCFEVSVTQVVPNTLRHCALRGRNGALSLASHSGEDIISDSSLTYDSALWARRPSHLTFASPQPAEGWKGSIFMIAIYDRYLSNVEVATNQELGPPNSSPVASAASSPLAITEDVTTTLYP